MGSQFHGSVNGHGAVGAADNTDGSSFSQVEAQKLGSDEGYENAQMGSSTKDDKAGIGNHGAEVRHGAYAQKNEGRKDEFSTPW